MTNSTKKPTDDWRRQGLLDQLRQMLLSEREGYPVAALLETTNSYVILERGLVAGRFEVPPGYDHPKARFYQERQKEPWLQRRLILSTRTVWEFEACWSSLERWETWSKHTDREVAWERAGTEKS